MPHLNLLPSPHLPSLHFRLHILSISSIDPAQPNPQCIMCSWLRQWICTESSWICRNSHAHILGSLLLTILGCRCNAFCRNILPIDWRRISYLPPASPFCISKIKNQKPKTIRELKLKLRFLPYKFVTFDYEFRNEAWNFGLINLMCRFNSRKLAILQMTAYLHRILDVSSTASLSMIACCSRLPDKRSLALAWLPRNYQSVRSISVAQTLQFCNHLS